MANATTVTTTIATVRPMHASTARIIRIEMPRKGPQGIQAPTPLVPSGKPICVKRHRASNLPQIDSGKAHAAANAKRAQWATLNLRQEWATLWHQCATKRYQQGAAAGSERCFWATDLNDLRCAGRATT